MAEKEALEAALYWLQQEDAPQHELELEKNATQRDQEKIRQFTGNVTLYHKRQPPASPVDQLRGR